MARKKIEPIKNFGNDMEKLTVLKSKPLFALWRSDISLAEFKILDSYLGRINSHDTENRTVRFEKGKLEELLGVQKISIEDLDKRIANLMTTVHIPDDTRRDGFSRVALFEEANCQRDEYGQWTVDLTCTKPAMKYVFNIDDIGYLRYKLRCVISMKSRYTYIMFLYLWDNKYRGTWEIPLEELKIMLNCENEQTYKEFKRFNDLILKKVQKEIHEVTDIKYDYETVKKGRYVIGIRFKYHAQIEDIDPNQITIEQYQQDLGRELWESALDEFSFSPEQIGELREVLIVIPDKLLPQSPACHGALELRRYHYMQIKAAEIKRRNAEKPIRSKFAYLLKLLKQDVET